MRHSLNHLIGRPLAGLIMLGGLLAFALVALPFGVNSSLQLVEQSAQAKDDKDHKHEKKHKKYKKDKKHKKYGKYKKKEKYRSKCEKFRAKYREKGKEQFRQKARKYCGKWRDARDARDDDDDDDDDDDRAENRYEKLCKVNRAKFRETGNTRYRERAKRYCQKWRDAGGEDDRNHRDRDDDDREASKYEEKCKANRAKFRETGNTRYRERAKRYCQKWRDAGGEDDRDQRRLDQQRRAEDAADPDLSRLAKQDTNGFKNHGQEVRNRVEMAKAMGLNPSVGAQAANHGDMYDALNQAGRDDLVEDLVDAKDGLKLAEEEGDPTEVALAKDELDAVYDEINDVVPQNGYTNVDMDVTGDGKFDAADLEAQKLLNTQ